MAPANALTMQAPILNIFEGHKAQYQLFKTWYFPLHKRGEI